MITIKSMGEGLGDLFFIELEKNGKKCVIMVDGHTVKQGYTKETQNCINEYEKIDYLIVTHIDGDHIKGVIKFLEDKKFCDKFEDTVIIYNFVTKNVVNYKDAFKFEKMIDGRCVLPTWRCDYTNYKDEFLKIISLKKRTKFNIKDENAYLTFIAPDKEGVQLVYEDYCSKLRKAENNIKNIAPPKKNITNSNSIVFLLEFEGKKLLFMGDNDINHIEPLIDGLNGMNTAKIDLIKIGHHGAKEENNRLVGFAKKYNCNKFIVTGEKEWKGIHLDKNIMKNLDASGITDIKLYTSVNLASNSFNNIEICNHQIISI